MKFNRIFLIVCDSMGIGNAKDAKKYNDFGANTVGHICSICDGLNIPTLQNLGFGNLGDFKQKNLLLHLQIPVFLKNLLTYLRKKLVENV